MPPACTNSAQLELKWLVVEDQFNSKLNLKYIIFCQTIKLYCTMPLLKYSSSQLSKACGGNLDDSRNSKMDSQIRSNWELLFGKYQPYSKF